MDVKIFECPSVSRNADSIAKVREIVAKDRLMTLLMMADEFEMEMKIRTQFNMKIWERIMRKVHPAQA